MRIRLITLLVFLLMAGPAEASVTWVVKGHGFGHGVGMSQYGAYGYAKNGKGYRFILGHYYSGTTIGQLTGPRVVRVLLDIEGGDVGFSAATSACGKSLDPARGCAPPPGGRSPTAGRSCEPPVTDASTLPALGPTAARWRLSAPTATPAPST
jgi:hypothetical protein